MSYLIAFNFTMQRVRVYIARTLLLLLLLTVSQVLCKITPGYQ